MSLYVTELFYVINQLSSLEWVAGLVGHPA